RAGARRLDPVAVALLRVGLHGRGSDVGARAVVPGLVVEDRLQPRHRTHAHVIVGAGDHHLVRLDVLVEHELPGIRALDPQILRRLAAEHVADFRPNDVGEPIHVSLRMVAARYMAAWAKPASRYLDPVWPIPRPVWRRERLVPAKPPDRLRR